MLRGQFQRCPGMLKNSQPCWKVRLPRVPAKAYTQAGAPQSSCGPSHYCHGMGNDTLHVCCSCTNCLPIQCLPAPSLPADCFGIKIPVASSSLPELRRAFSPRLLRVLRPVRGSHIAAAKFSSIICDQHYKVRTKASTMLAMQMLFNTVMHLLGNFSWDDIIPEVKLNLNLGRPSQRSGWIFILCHARRALHSHIVVSHSL